MSYQVIARKWRPQTFEEVTGQEAITGALRNAVEHERLHHAYLFSGARGVGKTTTARLLAKALNCHKTPKPNPTPCAPSDPDACASCREIAEGRSIDVLEFDAASNTQVDKIRDLIIENINIAPARDRYKVFIIDEVHMLSTSSFNALLKTLEEPPTGVAFIMATTELHKVPDTILSRCQEFEFRTIAVAKIFERLKLIAVAEKINITDEALREIARSGEGSMRDAQSNFDQVISFSGEQIDTNDVTSALGLASSEMLVRIIKAIAENNAKDALAVVEDLIRRGQDLRNFCRDLLSFLRDLLVTKIAGDAENLLESASVAREQLNAHAANFSESDLVRFFNSLSDTAEKLRTATQERYILEIGLIKLIEMRRLTPLEKILERLAKLESAFGSGDSPATFEPPQNSASVNSVAPPVAEKKTSIVDFAREEVPFEIGESPFVAFAATSVEHRQAPPIAVEPPAPEPPPFYQPAHGDEFSDESHPITGNPFNNDGGRANGNHSANGAQSANVIGYQPLDDFLDSVQIKLPPISAEELEHIEDNWLDNAYEEKLRREGDTLDVIAAATEIIVRALGENANAAAAAAPSFQTTNGATAAAPVRAQTKPIFVPPDFDTDDVPGEIIELSENPTDEELMRYAENHPLVKRALRIFRGKIVKVNRNNQTNA